MACSCNDKTAPFGWVVTRPDGTTLNFRTMVEAAAAANRVPHSSYTRAKAPQPA